MAQAYDVEGNKLGRELIAESMRSVFLKALEEHPDAHEIRVRKLSEFQGNLLSEFGKGETAPNFKVPNCS